MKKVMAFGTFDGLHPGHLFYLREAKKHGGFLVVVVARDRNVRILKGRSPESSQDERLERVRELDFVDQAVLGDIQVRKWNVIKRHAPVVIALGYDQWASIPTLRRELEKAGLRPQIVRVPSFKPEKFKSSKLRKA